MSTARTAPPSHCRSWLADVRSRFYTHPTRIPLESVADWHTRPDAATIRHRTGRFFTIEGIRASLDGAPTWARPIVRQTDIGVLGLLVTRRGDGLKALVQAKPEPGNINGLQVSTTVQATHSNYSRVHGGRPVPYLDRFVSAGDGRIIVDSRQSEHGSVFLRKRNRNLVVAVDRPPPAEDGFAWLPLAEVYRLLHVDDLVSMDLRTVLGCLPWRPGGDPPAPDTFQAALARSGDRAAPARHRMADLLHWITDVRCQHRVELARVPLPALSGWCRAGGVLAAENGGPFTIIGVSVEAAGREVRSWSQPMIEVSGTGLLALLVTRVGGVLHLLMQLRVEPGLVDVVELAPTVQELPGEPRPTGPSADDHEAALRALALAASPEQVRLDTVQSEEGGRFFHTRNRHLIVEVPPPGPEPPGYRWLTVYQLRELLRHSYYVNVQARSLLSCLTSLAADEPGSPC